MGHLSAEPGRRRRTVVSREGLTRTGPGAVPTGTRPSAAVTPEAAPALRPARRHLIEELLVHAGEPAYAEVHARSGTGATSAVSRWSWRFSAMAVLLVIGLLVTMGAQTLRAKAAPSSPRAELAQQLVERQQVQREQSAAVARETRAVAELQGLALDGAGDEQLARRYQAAAVAAAATEVVGPGVRVVLDDPHGQDPENRVQARDLQRTANDLWAAGAQAVSVNGHRLSSTAGIRYAGRALVVDFRALEPPYTVDAVGDDDLATRYEAVGGAAHLETLRAEYAVRASHEARAELIVPADETLALHHAHPITTENP